MIKRKIPAGFGGEMWNVLVDLCKSWTLKNQVLETPAEKTRRCFLFMENNLDKPFENLLSQFGDAELDSTIIELGVPFSDPMADGQKRARRFTKLPIAVGFGVSSNSTLRKF